MINLKCRYHLFPFEKVPANSRIIIWGAGEVGRSYIQQVLKSQYCHITCAVDKNADAGFALPVPVFFPTHIKEAHFDYVVIGVGKEKIVDEIRNVLSLWGISEERIIGRTLSLVAENNIDETKYSCFHGNDYLALQEMIPLYAVPSGGRLVRIGNQNDGGYIMLDDFKNRNIAYSFGIDGDVGWDDAIADRGLDVYMYDHTISSLVRTRKEFHFFQQGIAGRKEGMKDTLASFVYQNGHKNKHHMILKMDVEGTEWDFLESVDDETLFQFDQIVIEMHDLLDVSKYGKIISGLEKIGRTHYAIHVHANNWGAAVYTEGKIIPDTLEVSYVNRRTYSLQKNMSVDLPISIDAPCGCYIPEIRLGKWNQL